MDKEVKELHRESIVIDAHSDIPLNLFHHLGQQALVEEHLKLLTAGGVNILFVNLYAEVHPEASLKQAMVEIGELYRQVEESPDFKLIRDQQTLKEVLDGDEIGLVLSMEGMEPLSNEPGLLRVFKELGLFSAALTWNYRNYYAAGIDDRGGLSKLGKQIIELMNELNILIDVSHLNEEGFWQVMELTEGPVIASHSNAYKVFPHPRNLKDNQIKAIVESGGVIGLNNYFTAEEESASLTTFIDQLEYILNLAGEDAVGLGLDFNGYLGEMITPGLEDASRIPDITAELIARGYSGATIKKILGNNFLKLLERI